MPMRLIMSGLDYNLAPIALREPLSFTRAQAGAVLRDIRGAHPGLSGAVLLSTCNRTELYLTWEEGAAPSPGALLCQGVGLEYTPFAPAFVTREGRGAVRHLMEVAGGLRSQIWGEDQIVTQVKGAILLARELGAADGVLETLFRNAAAAGKELKTKVRLRGVETSAAARAVAVLKRETGALGGKRALVVGNGEMGRLAASLLRDEGCAVSVTLRTYRHGETVVPAGCGVVPYDERLTAMEGADILLSATTSPHFTVTAEQVSSLTCPPAYVVDLALPRDVDPAVGGLPGITLYNVDTLGAEARRDVLPPEAEAILADHLNRFYDWLNYRKCLPAIEELKEAIVRRVRASSALEGDLTAEEAAELAVARAVELITGGLKEKFTPEDLERCAEKIRLHTAARPLPATGTEGRDHGRRVALSPVR